MASSPKPSSLSPLYAICDAEVCERHGWSLIDFASACLDGGATLVQVRAKTLPSASFLAACEAIVRRAAPDGRVIVNDRADIARLAGAAGAHVGQDDLPPRDVRRLLGDDAIVGFSTHTLAQLHAALDERISYVAVGPVFGTRTKETGYDAIGLSHVSGASAAVGGRMPVVAIGGITLERAAAVLDAGADALAVISDLFVGGNPSSRVRAWLDAIGGRV